MEKDKCEIENKGLASLMFMSLGYAIKLKGDTIDNNKPYLKNGFTYTSVALCAISAIEGMRSIIAFQKLDKEKSGRGS
jgi:mannose/fructose/N-acetylgalactosamine-specific phosphotransferase system component IIC